MTTQPAYGVAIGLLGPVTLTVEQRSSLKPQYPVRP